MISRLVFLLLLVPAMACGESGFCLAQYKQDFSFAVKKYSVDTGAGLTAEVSWGPHGYVGAILLPREGERGRVLLERFETFYRSLNCQWASIEDVWDSSLQQATARKNCTALVFGGSEATFQCGALWESYQRGEDALGPFQKYTLKGSGAWYQTEEYFAAKTQLDQLVSRALIDAHDSISEAVGLADCETDIQPEKIELPEIPTASAFAESRTPIDATIEFTVGTDGTVSEILLGQTANYEFEYFLAGAAWKSQYPARAKPCRRTWVFTYGTGRQR